MSEQRRQDLHLPGLRAARRAGRIRSADRSRAFCDLEEHNALTAHQERQRLAPGEPPSDEEIASDG